MFQSAQHLAQFLKAQLASPIFVMRGLLGRLAALVPDARDRFAFRRFWGDALFSTGALFVIDAYENVKLKNEFRWALLSAHDQSVPASPSPAIIDGAFAPQATSILTTLFAQHAGGRLRVATDAECDQPEDAPLICYGTSDANSKTFEVEAGSGTALCKLLLNDRGERSFCVGGRLFSIETRGGVTYDKAVVLRFTHQDRHGAGTSCSQVVCAGLSEWGSLAAVRYLTAHWRNLQRRFDRFGKRRDFCVLLEVPCGQFEHSREMISATLWNAEPIPDSELAPDPLTKPPVARMRR